MIVVAERGVGASLLKVDGVVGVNEEVVSFEEESLGNMPWPIVKAGVFIMFGVEFGVRLSRERIEKVEKQERYGYQMQILKKVRRRDLGKGFVKNR